MRAGRCCVVIPFDRISGPSKDRRSEALLNMSKASCRVLLHDAEVWLWIESNLELLTTCNFWVGRCNYETRYQKERLPVPTMSRWDANCHLDGLLLAVQSSGLAPLSQQTELYSVGLSA